MMEKCDPEIATWSESGDSFVVKSLDKFSKVRRIKPIGALLVEHSKGRRSRITRCFFFFSNDAQYLGCVATVFQA